VPSASSSAPPRRPAAAGAAAAAATAEAARDALLVPLGPLVGPRTLTLSRSADSRGAQWPSGTTDAAYLAGTATLEELRDNPPYAHLERLGSRLEAGFRAAAAEQLDVWAARAGAELVKGKDEADPASVVFDAIKRAIEVGADLVLADTAGRLHTKANLMEELKKVKRVAEKALPGAPHEVLLVLDSTMGQNGIAQAKEFRDAVGVTSIALTKLDGTAKGGVIIGICDELKVPVAWAGVGEKVADLRKFDPKEFVDALFE
jgi:hypothetical protein